MSPRELGGESTTIITGTLVQHIRYYYTYILLAQIII